MPPTGLLNPSFQVGCEVVQLEKMATPPRLELGT
jgi:hypothetical protein